MIGGLFLFLFLSTIGCQCTNCCYNAGHGNNYACFYAGGLFLLARPEHVLEVHTNHYTPKRFGVKYYFHFIYNRGMKLPFPKVTNNTISSLGLATIGAAIILLIAGLVNYVQEEQQRQAIDNQTSKTNQLIEEVRSLSQENKELNQENRNYSYCNAILLAKYTQDQQPIQIDDLEKCILTSFPQGGGPSDNAQSQVQQSFGLQPTGTAGATAPISSMQSGSTGAVIQPSSPVITPAPSPIVPATPATPPLTVGGSEQNPNQILSIPNVIILDTPCVSVIGTVKTCQ